MTDGGDMSENILIALITFIGSSTVTAAVAAYISRRKTEVDVRKATAEAEAIESATRQSEVEYYRGRVEQNIKQMERLETEVASLKTHIENIQAAYEQRVGELHGKIDRLASELDRANSKLDASYKTIGELRQEVKDGNIVITELRNEITQLLVDRAAKKEGE